MMALLLSTAWRQIAGVNELVRLVRTEALVWEKPQKVSQQALSLRLSSMPAELFLNVLNQLLPIMQQRWQARLRPLAAEIQWAYEHFANVLIVDGSTLDALIKKIGLLQAFAKNPLAGKIDRFVGAWIAPAAQNMVQKRPPDERSDVLGANIGRTPARQPVAV